MHSFLPRRMVDEVSKGQHPDAVHCKNATVLYADVVGFSQFIRGCKPNDVISALTCLQTHFNRACRVHETFRVEAIGDAYMVVSGAPDDLPSHAERIANTALAMVIAAREVTSPRAYEDKSTAIKVRIGLHSGPVVCGVVGDILPRFLVFGQTTNVASRMESHGEAGRVHMSQKTHDLLRKTKKFKTEKRGKIDVRGEGKMTTYFLLANESVPEEDLMGRGSRDRHPDAVSVTFINEGHQETPPGSSGSVAGSRTPLTTRNRVAPSSESHNGTPTSREERVVPMLYGDSPKRPLAGDTGSKATPKVKV